MALIKVPFPGGMGWAITFFGRFCIGIAGKWPWPRFTLRVSISKGTHNTTQGVLHGRGLWLGYWALLFFWPRLENERSKIKEGVQVG